MTLTLRSIQKDFEGRTIFIYSENEKDTLFAVMEYTSGLLLYPVSFIANFDDTADEALSLKALNSNNNFEIYMSFNSRVIIVKSTDTINSLYKKYEEKFQGFVG